MHLPALFQSMGILQKEVQISELLSLNQQTKAYGLVLTKEEAGEVLKVRSRILQSYGRIELGVEMTKALIQSICPSSYICQENYLSTLHELHELFYYLKNETQDKIGDDELMDTIKHYFNHSCGGSVELLRGRDLEKIIRDFRRREHEMEDHLEEGDLWR